MKIKVTVSEVVAPHDEIVYTDYKEQYTQLIDDNKFNLQRVIDAVNYEINIPFMPPFPPLSPKVQFTNVTPKEKK